MKKKHLDYISTVIIETVLEHSQREPTEQNLDNLIELINDLISDHIKIQEL